MEHQQHHHEHNHDHGEHCGCGCHDAHHTHVHEHDTENQKFINDTMIFSKTWEYSIDRPAAARQLEEKAHSLFMQLGDDFSVEGVILGHIKGVIKTEPETFYALSMTRQGQTDITASKLWSADNEVTSYSFTLNILSMVHKPVDEKHLHEAMKI